MSICWIAAISIGGDSDTIAAITGAVAGAYYGVPEDIREKALEFLSGHLIRVLFEAEVELAKKREGELK